MSRYTQIRVLLTSNKAIRVSNKALSASSHPCGLAIYPRVLTPALNPGSSGSPRTVSAGHARITSPLTDAPSNARSNAPSIGDAQCTDGRTDGLTENPLTLRRPLALRNAHARTQIRPDWSLAR